MCLREFMFYNDLPGITLPQTNLQVPINQLDQPTNPTNPQRRSENFAEKLRIFQQQEENENVKIQHPTPHQEHVKTNLQHQQT